MHRIGDELKVVVFLSIPTMMVTAGFTLFGFPLSETTKTLLLIPLFLGLFLLLIGYLGKKGSFSVIRAAGWGLFAFYWSTQISTLYYYEGGDIVNATICTIGVYVLIYFAYKEFTTDRDCMPWLAGAASIAGLVYFFMEKIPVLKRKLIETVARHSALLYSVFDKNIRVENSFIWAGRDYINGSAPTAEIIFACTAIQSMLLFVGLILPLREVSLKRRLTILAFLMVTIYFLNLIRNASVLYLVGYGITDMNIAHNYIGKIGSLIALVALVIIVFRYIPELYDKIICTINLYKEEGFVERGIKRIVRR